MLELETELLFMTNQGVPNQEMFSSRHVTEVEFSWIDLLFPIDTISLFKNPGAF